METSGRELVVFSLGVRIAYIGELVDDCENKVKMKRVLMLEREVDPRTGEVGAGSISPVTHASRDSEICLDKRVVMGVLIRDPNPELVKVYEREIGPCYSPLVATASNLSL